jgi:hypothetical protein
VKLFLFFFYCQCCYVAGDASDDDDDDDAACSFLLSFLLQCFVFVCLKLEKFHSWVGAVMK